MQQEKVKGLTLLLRNTSKFSSRNGEGRGEKKKWGAGGEENPAHAEAAGRQQCQPSQAGNSSTDLAM